MGPGGPENTAEVLRGGSRTEAMLEDTRGGAPLVSRDGVPVSLRSSMLTLRSRSFAAWILVIRSWTEVRQSCSERCSPEKERRLWEPTALVVLSPRVSTTRLFARNTRSAIQGRTPMLDRFLALLQQIHPAGHIRDNPQATGLVELQASPSHTSGLRGQVSRASQPPLLLQEEFLRGL